MENTEPTIINQAVNFSEEETREISEVSKDFENIKAAFGNLSFQKLAVERVEEDLKSKFRLLEKKEESFFNKIIKKYGEGVYDPKTNTFTPNKK